MSTKMTRRQSSITTLRRSPPSTPQIAEKFMNFMGNVHEQRAVHPKNLSGSAGWTTTNKSGKAATARNGMVLGENSFANPKQDRGTIKV
jgi:hypothetical protein